MANRITIFGGARVTHRAAYRFAVYASAAASALTIASLFGRHPYLELTTHFRLQYALTLSALAPLLFIFRSRKLLPLALCCAALNWAHILPYYSAQNRPAPKPSAVHLKLMLSNVQGSNKHYEALTTALGAERPDIAVLQEFTEEWQEHVHGPDAQRPYSAVIPRPGGSGMAVFSRYPLEQAEILTLDASTHPALLVRVSVEGVKLTVLSLHPPMPARADKFANRNRQIVNAASIMKGTEGAKVLIGDLNTTMWSPYFTDLIRESGLRDARVGFGLSPSWPAPLPSFLQIPIDHCLVGEGITVEDVRTGAYTGSDHRPLVVNISF
jgi:endonuclease/exonuclease/phosphatase (EEP) superfamily protein YafD